MGKAKHTPIQLPLPLDNLTVAVPLTNGRAAIVDAVDADLLSSTWNMVPNKTNPYATRATPTRKTEYMHKVVLARKLGRELESHEQGDHINRDSLDNRRSNLRVATELTNKWNQGIRSNNTSGYKGVSFQKDAQTWDAQICVAGQHHRLGQFDSAEDAAIAYNHAATLHHGDYAVLNDIPDWENRHPVRRRANDKPRRDNTSGYLSVTWHKKERKWRAQTNIDGRRTVLGRFNTPEEAYAAYCEARAKQMDSKRESA